MQRPLHLLQPRLDVCSRIGWLEGMVFLPQTHARLTLRVCELVMMSLVALVTDIRVSSVQTLGHSFLVRKFVNQEVSGLALSYG